MTDNKPIFTEDADEEINADRDVALEKKKGSGPIGSLIQAVSSLARPFTREHQTNEDREEQRDENDDDARS
jgi:hypothetical protein